MKIRSLLELSEFLDRELSWRKKELTAIKLMLGSLRPHERQAMLRAGLCLLYAHWEGFVKNAATSYVTYVSTRGLKYRELAPNFVALGFRGRIREFGASARPSLHTKLVAELMSDLKDQASLSPNTAVDTASNLNFENFEEVLCVLGLNRNAYLSKKALIDERLTRNRHQIAHGQSLQIEEREYLDLHSEIIDMVDLFRNDLENAAATNAYEV